MKVSVSHGLLCVAAGVATLAIGFLTDRFIFPQHKAYVDAKRPANRPILVAIADPQNWYPSGYIKFWSIGAALFGVLFICFGTLEVIGKL